MRARSENGRDAPTEAGLLRQCKEEVRRRGWMFARMTFAHGATAGWPDLCVLRPGGSVAWAELKAKSGKKRALQMLKISQLQELGHDAEIVYSLDEFCALLDRPKRLAEPG